MQPLPVPTSTITGRVAPRSSSSAASTTSSVSGRGISTSGVTRNSCFQKACVPVRCWSGTRRARSPTRRSNSAACSGATAAVCEATSVARSQPSTWRSRRSASHSGRDTPAVSSSPVARATSSAAVMPGRGRPQRPAGAFSFSAWWWAISPATISSRSPSSTSCRRCSVSPMRWSVTRACWKL